MQRRKFATPSKFTAQNQMLMFTTRVKNLIRQNSWDTAVYMSEDDFARGFQKDLESIISEEGNSRAILIDKIIPMLSTEYPGLWASLLASSMNVKMAKYLSTLGVEFNNPGVLWEILQWRPIRRLKASSSSFSSYEIDLWEFQKKRIDAIIKWFATELNISPNDLVDYSDDHSQYGGIPGPKVSIICNFELLVKMDGTNNSFVMQRLIFYGGNIYQPMEVVPRYTKPSYVGSLLKFISDKKNLWASAGRHSDEASSDSEDEASSSMVMTGETKFWDLNGLAWISIAISIYAKNLEHGEGEFSDEQIDSIMQVMLPNEYTIAQQANWFRALQRIGGFTDLFLIECISNNLSYELLVLLERLDLFKSGLFRQRLNRFDTIAFETVEPGLHSNVIDYALRHGAINFLRFSTDRGFVIPDESVDMIRPDLALFFKSNLGLFGFSKRRIAEYYGELENRE